jgi:SAM-dependent methyltransferase
MGSSLLEQPRAVGGAGGAPGVHAGDGPGGEIEFRRYLESKATEYGFAEPKRSVWLRYMADARRGESLLTQALDTLAVTDRRPRRVMDLGCGFGGLLRAIAARYGAAYGVEILADRAAWAKRRCRSGQVVCADAAALPWPDGFFDLVLSTDVFEHVDFRRQQAAAHEIFRVLAPGGMAYITIPSRFQCFDEHNYVWFGTWLPHVLRARYTRLASANGSYLRCWERSAGGWRRTFERAGFDVRVVPVRPVRWKTADRFRLRLSKPLAA